MLHPIVRTGLVVVFAATAMGCAAYEVKTEDVDGFRRARAEVLQSVKVLDQARKAGADDPVGAELRREMQTNESTASDLLEKKKKLETDEVRVLEKSLMAYRAVVAELVRSATEDRQLYVLVDDAVRSAALKDSVSRMENDLSGVEKNLADFLGGTREAYDRQLRFTVAALGDALLLVDTQWQKALERRIDSHAAEPAKAEELRQKVARMHESIERWLKVVDEDLKKLAAAQTAPPVFLIDASALLSAITESVGSGDGVGSAQTIALMLTAGLTTVVQLVPQGTDFGIKTHDAIVIVSEEFSKVVVKYQALHKA